MILVGVDIGVKERTGWILSKQLKEEFLIDARDKMRKEEKSG